MRISTNTDAHSPPGSITGQFNFWGMYYEGKGLPRDYVLAHAWPNLAAAQGNDNAIKNREILETLMTPAQIAQAQRLAREWEPKGK